MVSPLAEVLGMWWASRTVLVAIAVAAGLAGAARADLSVWTLTETRHVLRDDPAGPTKDVALGLARNEWRGFQILLRSDAPVKGINIVPGDLTAPDGAVLRASDARLYRQHQMELKVGTYRNKDFRPGWYPDPLIPFDHPMTRKALPEARLKAVPFDLPANETHGFWVDLYAPMDAKPGQYQGTYRVTASDGKAAEVPVTVTVWNFALPVVPTLVTAFGSPADQMRGYYAARAKAGKEAEPTEWPAVEDHCAEELSRHRINATPPAAAVALKVLENGAFVVPPEQIMFFRMFIDNYHINAFQVPHPAGAVKDPDKDRERLMAWLKAWDRAAAELARPHVVFYVYLKDEPNDLEAYDYVRSWGRPIFQAKGAVKVMVVEQAKPQNADWGDLIGSVNIWCPLFSLYREDYDGDRLMTHREPLWTYTALCQGDPPSPWWHIDWPLMNYRVTPWTAWQCGMTGLLYWGGMAYWNEVGDPWTDAWTYGHAKDGKGLVYNGEGTLVYPARAVGYDGIVPSLRLKALRDGIEDYEYLMILRRVHLEPQADDVAEPLAASWYEWEKDPAAFEKGRRALADLILKKDTLPRIRVKKVRHHPPIPE